MLESGCKTMEYSNKVISVIVKPNSSKGSVVVVGGDGVLTVYLRAKPHDGEANRKLIETLAEHLGIAKTKLEIIAGHKSRIKRIKISK
jgi:uncharacterized protein (TIGR00251 family)